MGNCIRSKISRYKDEVAKILCDFGQNVLGASCLGAFCLLRQNVLGQGRMSPVLSVKLKKFLR